MVVTANDLDKGVKTNLRDEILTRLLKKDRALPLPSETAKISEVITGDTMHVLEEIIKDYYREFFESSDVSVQLTKDDYLNIYLNRI